MGETSEPFLTKAYRHVRISLYKVILSQRRMYRSLAASVSPNLLVSTGSAAPPDENLAALGVPAEVVAYFADSPARAYQLRQWLPVLETLNQTHPVVVVMRSPTSFELFRELTALPLVFTRRLRDLEDVLDKVDAKLCLYVNNSVQNFQPLSWRRALHVHLNHGESDKISMASNQAKAYDAVFIAGEAAERRYLENLIGFDGEPLVRVGRPQLDVELPQPLEPASRPTVMYAPTWEGDTAAMDYTSLAKYGPRLVEALLADGGFRVVYKPHPRVAGASSPVAAAHERILKALASANGALPPRERHVVEIEGEILPLFAACDVLVCDVSSVALDWLYLRTESPLWLLDPYDDHEQLVRRSPLAASVGVIDSKTIDDVVAALRASLDEDTLGGAREEARRFYFGELKRGESTKRFLEAVDDLIARRDSLLELHESATGEALGTGVVSA